MSTIPSKKKDGKVVAFKFTTYVGKDDQGTQKYKTTTRKPPNGLSVAKARKLAEAEAYRWEQEIKGNQPEHGEYMINNPADLTRNRPAHGFDVFPFHIGHTVVAIGYHIAAAGKQRHVAENFGLHLFCSESGKHLLCIHSTPEYDLIPIFFRKIGKFHVVG